MLDPGGAGGVAGPSAADASAGRKRSSTPSFSPPPLKGSFITGQSRCGQWRSTTSLRTAAVADDPLQDRHTSSVRGTYIRASKRLKNACVRLHRLDGAGDLNDAARGLLGVGVGAISGELHAASMWQARIPAERTHASRTPSSESRGHPESAAKNSTITPRCIFKGANRGWLFATVSATQTCLPRLTEPGQ
jgi:hypothetical protein